MTKISMTGTALLLGISTVVFSQIATNAPEMQPASDGARLSTVSDIIEARWTDSVKEEECAGYYWRGQEASRAKVVRTVDGMSESQLLGFTRSEWVNALLDKVMTECVPNV
jgi:hypothetical protein